MLNRLCGLVDTFWLHIQRSEFDSRYYQIFWWELREERGPLNFLSTTEKLLEVKSSRSGL
jgi:hypothetical protein